jgi:hypothetical protein
LEDICADKLGIGTRAKRQIKKGWRDFMRSWENLVSGINQFAVMFFT